MTAECLIASWMGFGMSGRRGYLNGTCSDVRLSPSISISISISLLLELLVIHPPLRRMLGYCYLTAKSRVAVYTQASIATMGGQQSKPSASRAHDKAMVDRLRKMNLQENSISGEVNEKSGKLTRDAEPLPLDAVSLLPSTILADPRNRFVHARKRYISHFKTFHLLSCCLFWQACSLGVEFGQPADGSDLAGFQDC